MLRCFSLIALGAIALTVPAQAQDLLVKASRIVLAPGTELAPGQLLIRAGKVQYVGDEIPTEARQNARVIDYGKAVITPGFVLAQATLGQDADLAEAAFAFTPDLLAAEAFDPWHEDLDSLAPQGITSFALSPSQRNVAGGIAALAKPGTTKAGDHMGRIAERELHLHLSLNRAARNQQRAPTSLIGALDMLRTVFTAAKSGVQGGPDIAILAQVLDGSRRVFAHADTYTELSGLLDLARDFNFEPVIVGGGDAEKVMPRITEQKAGIVLSTLRPEMRLAQLRLPGKLAAAGVPFAFGGDPKQLRMSAVLAVRHGLDKNAALAAMTRAPAEMLGQETNVGALRTGCAADFNVWSGHPLDLHSSHLASWVDGQLLAGNEPKEDR
ncbi:MAG: amidohydrolase family protein [bacterium]|nr:amidohydrolase family protein [bacterium]